MTGRRLGVGARLACAYLASYYLSFPNDFPGSQWLSDAITAHWLTVVKLVGSSVGVAIEHSGGGSGDTLFDHIRIAIIFCVAAIVTVAWRWAPRDDARDERIVRAVRLFLRYMAAYFLVSYGLSKVLVMQMPPTSPSTLLERYGDASPMGLLWTFIGASPAYEIFGGLAEVVPGLLLLFRRTALLGGLLAFGVVLNVVLFNLCYDVCVKVFSIHLLATLAYLVAPDLRRLVDVFVRQRPTTPPAADPPLLRLSSRSRAIAKVAVIAYLIGWSCVADAVAAYFKYGAGAPRSELWGVYDVESLVRDGKPVAPSLTEIESWHHVAFDRTMSIWMLDESVVYYRASYDAGAGTLALQRRGRASTLIVGRPDADHVTLGGVLGTSLVSARLRRMDESKFLLRSRGFNWINDGLNR
jgi:hypothetical protein